MSLYTPYKAVGLVTDGSPFVVNRLGEETFVMTSIGSMFQVYRLDHLTLCLVSQSILGKVPKQERITSIQALGTETFAAVGNSILVFDRTRVVRTYSEAHSTGTKITGLFMVGRLLLSYDEANVVAIIDVKERRVVGKIESTQQTGATISCITHPATYINKFVFGYSNGQLELWNINKKSLIYTFQSQLGFFSSQSSDAAPAVVCLEQSPACDVLGVGFESGHILLINLKLDRVLFSFRQEGSVTSLSFRTDASVFPYVASGSSDGRVHIWNLGAKTDDDEDEDGDEDDGSGYGSKSRTPRLERKLQNTIEEAHGEAVSRVYFVYGEPVLITASRDNSLKVWIFDSADGSARLLRHREGHSGHPLRLRYYGGGTSVSMRDNASAESCELVSCGSDGSIRLFNTAIEAQNKAFSQRPILKKLHLTRRMQHLPVCVGMDFCETRQRDWGNMVTIHKDHANAYVWNYRNRVATDVILRQADWKTNELMYSVDRSTHATAVAMTHCGNFALVGSRSGLVYVYNMQSGAPRGSFPGNVSLRRESGLTKVRTATPGNVLYEKKMILDDGKFSGSGSLNPSSASSSAGAKVVEVAETGLEVFHTQEVRGLFVDLTNSTLVSCSLDGLVIFWDFASRRAAASVSLNTPLLFLRGFIDSSFAAVAGQDRVVRLFDLNSRRLSRRFAGHSREVTDVAFAPDGRRLLSSSVDGTVHVFDIPTGRCISWLAFGAPVLSLAMSLSGEHLCVAQAGKEGVFLYLDRSLYETVQVWQEPTEPTPVADSVAVAEQALDGGEEDAEAGDDSQARADAAVKPVQAQTVTPLQREGAAQLGNKSITFSSLPRAYWTSLFNLEAIKARNKPKLPPAPPVAAPFFLPTIVRGGATPSFPTPQEFAALTKSLAEEAEAEAEAGSAKKRKQEAEAEGGAKRGKSSSSSSSSASFPSSSGPGSSSGSSSGSGPLSKAEEAKVMAELAAMSGAWDDAPDDADLGGDDAAAGAGTGSWDDEHEEEDASQGAKGRSKRKDEAAAASVAPRRSLSHLIDRKTALPRCKLVAHLLYEYPETDGASASASSLAADRDRGRSKVLDYLKTLPPPAVDVELRALCTHQEDEEGLSLLRFLLSWFCHRVSSGCDFELLEAYLHRTMLIHAEVIMKSVALAPLVAQLKQVHAEQSSKFRALVQGNMCCLKFLSNLPVT